MISLLLVLAILASFHTGVIAVETLIPLQKYGYAFSRGNLSSNVVVDLYIDLTCSSCLDSWPTLTELYDLYKEKVKFNYRVFPLPYHQQAFILAKAAQVVNYFGRQSAIFSFFDTAYALQPQIYNSATADMSYNQVIELVATWATTGTGVTKEQYYIGMNSSTPEGSTNEMAARYMWKYSCLHDIYATPLYAINGLMSDGLDTIQDWTAAIDPLLDI